MDLATSSILALDVGDKRIGVAVASQEALLPRPLTTLERAEDIFSKLQEVIEKENISVLVIGLPRGLDGQPTSQTHKVENFGAELKQRFDMPLHFQDEAVTSKQAEEELESRGKPYNRGDIDALAATYILEDYLATL